MNHIKYKPLFCKQESPESGQESQNQGKILKVSWSHQWKFKVVDPSPYDLQAIWPLFTSLWLIYTTLAKWVKGGRESLTTGSSLWLHISLHMHTVLISAYSMKTSCVWQVFQDTWVFVLNFNPLNFIWWWPKIIKILIYCRQTYTMPHIYV